MLPWAVRIALGVAEGVMLPVQDAVRARVQIRASLHQEGEEVQHALGALRHVVHPMRRIAVLEQALEEHAEKPVRDEKGVDQAPSGIASSANAGLSSRGHRARRRACGGVRGDVFALYSVRT